MAWRGGVGRGGGVEKKEPDLMSRVYGDVGVECGQHFSDPEPACRPLLVGRKGPWENPGRPLEGP